jgi:hypothetical protein
MAHNFFWRGSGGSGLQNLRTVFFSMIPKSKKLRKTKVFFRTLLPKPEQSSK